MADISVPISAKLDTTQAEAAVKSLIKSINKLNDLRTKDTKVSPAQVTGLTKAASSPKFDYQINEFKGSAGFGLRSVLEKNHEAIQKMTLKDLMSVRTEIEGHLKSNSLNPGVRATLQEIGEKLSKYVGSRLVAEMGSAEQFLKKAPNARQFINQAIPGAKNRTDVSLESTLSAFSTIGEEVMPGITGKIDSTRAAIDALGEGADSAKVTALLDSLFNEIDQGIGNYIRQTKAKISSSLLENSAESQAFLKGQINSGSKGAVIAGIAEQAGRTDLTKDQAVALSSNIGALSGELKPATTGILDSEYTLARKALEDAQAAVRRQLVTITAGEKTVTEAANADIPEVKREAGNAAGAIRSRRNRNQRTGGGGGGGSSYGPSPMGAGAGGGGGLGMAAKDMGDDADDAGRSVNSAFRKLNRVITDASAMLNSTATIAKGSLRVRDKPADLETFARDLSRGMQNYVNTVNDAFNNLELPSGRTAPRDILRDTVNESLRSGEVAGFTALSDEQRGLATAARGRAYGQAAGLQGPEAEKFALAYAKSVEDLVQQQTKLGEAVAIANLKTIEKNRADIDLLVQQGKYEEALKIARNTLLTKTERDATGNIRVTTEPIGKQTADDLTKKGYTTDAANMAFGEVEDTQRKVQRHKDINKEASGLSKLTRFAGQAMTVYGFLAMTIGTVAMKIAEVVEQANRLEKASATINALSGSMSKYQSVLSLATAQQNKFGGTLEENLQGFVSLVPVTKKFGLDLENVDNIARRLAIVDPLQGFSGAAIALKEFLSGDITSLSRRFEIDRKTLNSIKEAGTKAEQLKELDKVLNSMGISQGVLAARTATAAASFDKAGSAWNNYTTLLGQGAQEFLKPAADAVADLFADSAAELSNNLVMQNTEQGIFGQFDKAVTASEDISVNINEATTPASLLSDVLGKSVSSMTTLTYGAQNLQYELNNVVMSANNAVDELNKIRLANESDPSFVPFQSDETAIMAARASQYLGSAAVLRLREESFGYEPDRVSKNAFGSGATKSLNPLTSLDSNILEPMNMRISGGGNATSFEANILEKLAKASSLKLKGPDSEGLAGSALTSGALKGVVSEDELKNLTKAEQVNKILVKTLNDVTQGYVSAAVAVERFNVVLGAEKPELVIPGFIKEIERLQKIKDDYDAVIKKIGDNTFATELYNKSVGSINSTNQEINDTYTKQQALIYYNNTAVAQGDQSHIMAQKASEILATGLFDIEGDTVVERENGARIIAEASILQTRLLLSQEKSVSVIGAMGDNFGKYLVDLESAAKLAVDFNKSMSSLVTGPLMAGMSLQDQLNFGQMQMSGQVPGMQPQNQGDILSLTGQNLALVTQMEQEKLDLAQKGGKNSDEIKDMNKQFFKDQNKAQEEHNKDMKELEEEHLKKMEEMRRESEVSKRGNEVGFYESLFGMDNLTAGQVEQAGAEYQAIKAEATDLRNQGQFEKAAAVESAGKEGILSKYGDLEEKAKLMLDIKDADEETAELNKEMGEAKTADDRAEIQRKIEKIAVERAKYENELAQITALETLKKNLYDAELLNARTLQESETENYKLEVAKRETDFAEAEKEKTKKHNEEVAKRAVVADQAHKVQISNLNEQIALMTFSSSFLDEAYARTLTGPAQSTQLAAIYARRQTARDTIMNSTSLAAPTLQAGLRQLEASGPGYIQSMMESFKTPEADTTAQEVQRDLALKTFNLTTAMDKFTQAVLTGKVVITRPPGS